MSHEHIPYLELAKHIPIQKGDIIYLISDILELVKNCKVHGEKFECEAFLRTICDTIGSEGTLLIPVFNWDFCKGKTFDYRTTRGKTGALGNAALKMTEFRRTKHPLYSFMVWGKDAEFLTKLDNISGFGFDSPFQYLHRHDGKALSIGIKHYVGNTFIHYVEQMQNVAYRYEKTFSAKYIDENGAEDIKSYSMFVRDLEINPKFRYDEMLDDFMKHRGLLKRFELNGCLCDYVYERGVYDVISLDIINNQACGIYQFQ
ncbi:MAG: AAC(3) family N-acetyltransferase [Clostridium sp.]|jgi:aminoglycoside 3-N-acetyltransferase|nr:AAC(3) family N-acetyltransferase [Clostridium sp.]